MSKIAAGEESRAQTAEAQDPIDVAPPSYDTIAPAPPKDGSSQATPNPGAEPVKAPPAAAQAPQPHGGPVPVPNAGGPRMVTPLALLGDHATDVDCPYCQMVTTTSVVRTKEDRDKALVVFVIVGALIFWPILCCIPCIMGPSGYATVHHCSRCRNQLTFQPPQGPVQVVARPSQGQVLSQHAK